MEKLKTTPFTKYVGRRKRTYEVRRESNDEIMHQAVLEGKPIQLRVVVQIAHTKTHDFVGWQGVSLRKKVNTIPEAREFVGKLKELFQEKEKENGEQ